MSTSLVISTALCKFTHQHMKKKKHFREPWNLKVEVPQEAEEPVNAFSAYLRNELYTLQDL